MRAALILALLISPAYACEPADVGGTGSKLTKHVDDTGTVGVIQWTCGKTNHWIGVRGKKDLTLPVDKKALKDHLTGLIVKHAHDGNASRDLLPLVK